MQVDGSFYQKFPDDTSVYYRGPRGWEDYQATLPPLPPPSDDGLTVLDRKDEDEESDWENISTKDEEKEFEIEKRCPVHEHDAAALFNVYSGIYILFVTSAVRCTLEVQY